MHVDLRCLCSFPAFSHNMFHTWSSVDLVLLMVPGDFYCVSEHHPLLCSSRKAVPSPCSACCISTNFQNLSAAFPVPSLSSLPPPGTLIMLVTALALLLCAVSVSVALIKLRAPWNQGLRLIHLCAPSTWPIDWKTWAGWVHNKY